MYHMAASEQEAVRTGNIVEKYVAEIEQLKRELAVDIDRHTRK